MAEIIVATPLASVTRPYSLSADISVRKIEPILWESSAAIPLLSEREREEFSSTQYWLCVSKQETGSPADADDLYDAIRWAVWAIQVIHPSGCKNIYLEFRRTNDGFDNIGSRHSPSMRSTPMGRLAQLEQQGFEKDFGIVYDGVRRAFSEKIVRLQNPILLMEHGLSIANLHSLCTLFWVMGLDMLFMAVNSRAFTERISAFLEQDTPIFPKTWANQLPREKVSDVLNPLFDFRSIIAHGKELPKKPYREDYIFFDTEESEIVSGQYFELMQDAALFILCKALRKIFVDGLVDEVKNESSWRKRLQS